MRALAPLSFLLMAGALAYIGLKPPVATQPEPAEAPAVTLDQFGQPKGMYATSIETIRSGDTFSDLMSPFEVSGEQIAAVVAAAQPVFDIRKLQSGKDLYVYQTADSARKVLMAIYESDPTQYVVFDFGDSLHARLEQREVRTVSRSITGTVKGSLWETLAEMGVDPYLAVRLSEVYAWQIDFSRIYEGDRFTVAFEERLVEGQRVGLGRVQAAEFEHGDRKYEAFAFFNGEKEEYYDGDGNGLRRAFLIAPVEYKRISSRYSGRRFHPVQKRYKAHLGTDYAADTGTPIHATGAGTVIEAGYGRANGNYVKIKHNGTYTTQYLHMSKIKSGIRKGVSVAQGQVIGFVGQTGLANGPHVCYRFWKNGQQVDHLREDLPSVEPLQAELRPGFDILRDRWRSHLAAQQPVMVRQPDLADAIRDLEADNQSQAARNPGP